MHSGKNLIIGSFTNYTDYDVLKPWVQSIKDVGFSGDVVLIAVDTCEKLIKKLKEEDIVVISVPKIEKLLIHMQRFLHIYDFLKKEGHDYLYVISTDVRDVIFQSDPSIFLKDFFTNCNLKKIVVSSESIRICDEEWNKENIRNNFGDYFYNEVKYNLVCNVGVLAGYAKNIKELCFYLYQLSLNRPDWVADQAAYNILLNTHGWADICSVKNLSDGWAINAHVTNKPDLVEKYKPYLLEDPPVMDDSGVVRNAQGKAFVIVHQYDRVPEWMQRFSEKYQTNITKQKEAEVGGQAFAWFKKVESAVFDWLKSKKNSR